MDPAVQGVHKICMHILMSTRRCNSAGAKAQAQPQLLHLLLGRMLLLLTAGCSTNCLLVDWILKTD